MKKTMMKKIGLVLMAAVLMVAPTVVFAEGSGDIPPVEDLETVYDGYSEGVAISPSGIVPAAATTLDGTGYIIRNSSTSVTIKAVSTCSPKDPDLYAKATLQQYKDGKWINYSTPVSKSVNGTSVTAQKTITVPSGYYYRVKGIHSCSTKTKYSTTGGIKVG